MKVLKFDLSGKTAFFKKPEVNQIYFTYGQIHKLALLGILGSCLGLKGYNQQRKDEEYPEFYEKLRDLKVGIIPKSSENGVIRKKIQTFNNSTMFCNKGSDSFGANLIVTEQWLEQPKWTIYVKLDGEIGERLEDNFKTMTFKYVPYLGKNDHFANIDKVEIIDNVERATNIKRLHSMFKRDDFEFVDIYEDINYSECSVETDFKYQEKLPYELESVTNQYILDTFIYSNMMVSVIDDTNVYNVNGLNIYFI